MYWFKHLSTSLDDPFIFDLVSEFGGNGYLVFFGTLEILAREFDPKSPGVCTVSERFLTKKFQLSRQLLVKILNFCEKNGRFFLGYSNGKITINCPKLKDLTDEYTQRKIKKVSGQTPDSVGTMSRIELELELEEDKKKSVKEKPEPKKTGSALTVKNDKPKAKPKKKTTFPQDFALTDHLREYAKAQGYHNDLDRLFEDFRIHHCAKGTVHLDWGLALMKWIRNEVSWGKGGAQPIPDAKPGEPANVFANVPEYAHLKYADDDPAFHEWRERERQANERAAKNA